MPLLSDQEVGLGPHLLSDDDVGLGADRGLLTDEQVGLPPSGNKSSLRGAANAFLREGTRGIGRALQSAGAIAQAWPLASEAGALPSPELAERNAQRIGRSPAELLREMQRSPVAVAGQALSDVAPEVHPVPREEENSLVTKAAGMAGSFVPLIAAGPAGPAVIGLQAAGEHISADFDQAKTEGLDDDAAATRALDRALLSGTLQAGIFFALPKPIRAVAEKYLVAKLGQAGFARWLSGRAAAAGEGAILGGTSAAAENVVQEKPVMEGTAASAAGLAGANLLLPWLRERPRGPEPSPPSGNIPEGKPAPVTPADLASLQETLLKNQITQNRVLQAVEDLKAAGRAAPETPPPSAQAPPENAPPGPTVSEISAEHLTPPAEAGITAPGAGAETITGQNEQTGSEASALTASGAEPMPADPAHAGPTPRLRSPERERDLLDEVLEVGKISLRKARAIQEDFKPTGVVRAAFTNTGGMGPDETLDALHRAGLYHGLETEDDLLDALAAAGPNRVRARARIASDETRARVEAKQYEQFQSKVVRGQRPWREQASVTVVRVDDLLEGDEFSVQGYKFRVQKLEIDEDGRLLSVQVKDGPKFGVQRLGPEQAEFIHVDKDSLHRAGVLLREEPPLFGKPETVEQQKSRLSLEAENKKRAQQKAELQRRAAAPLAGARGDIGQRDLLGGGDLFSEEPGRLERLIAGTAAEKWADDILRGGATHAGPEVLAAYAVKGAALIERGVTDFSEWSAAMLERFGQVVRQHLDGLFKNARQIYHHSYRSGAPPDPQNITKLYLTTDRTYSRNFGNRTAKFLVADKKLLDLRDVAADQDATPRLSEELRKIGADVTLEPGVEMAVHLARPQVQDALRQAGYDTVRLNEWYEGGGKAESILALNPKETLLPLGSPRDKFLHWLDRAIEPTDPLKGARSLEGVFGAPVWITKSLAHGALKVIRASYQAGKKLAESLEDALNWLRAEKVQGFDEAQARRWLADLARNANPVIQRRPEGDRAEAASGGGKVELEDRQQQITARLNELNQQATRPGGISKEEKGERYQLAKERLAVQRELAQHPDHVAELLRAMDAAGKDLERAKQAGNGLAVREAGERFQSLAEQLELVKPDLMHRIYNDLVRAGEISGTQATELPAGRTLAELTRWLHQNKIDSPGLTLRERLDLAGRLADEFSRGKDALTWLANRLSAGWQAFKVQYSAPPLDTEFRTLFKHWLGARTWTGKDVHYWLHDINKLVPKPLRQMAISIYLDARGDTNLLRSQADLVPPRYRPIWEAALQLTEGEKKLARRLELDFEQKLEDGLNAGVLEKGRHEYGVPQIWKLAPKSDGAYDPTQPTPKHQRARNPGAKLDPGDPFFALQRTHPTYFDGIMAGGVPADLRIGNLVARYDWDFHEAMNARGFIKTLKEAREAPGPDQQGAGDPTVMISGRVSTEPRAEGQRVYFVDSSWKQKEAVTTDGRPYETVDHWALKGWKFASQDAEGNPIIVHGDFLVHPDHARFLRNELSKSALRDLNGPLASIAPLTRAILDSAAFLKASKFASAIFHLATIGEHTLFHGVLPITRGVDLDFIRNPRLERLVREGGLELGFGAPQELFDDGLSSHGGIYQHVPLLGGVMRRISDYLFKDFIPKVKAKVGLVVLERNLRRYTGKLSEAQIYELTGRQMNAAFGLQNWRLIGTNKTMLDVNRLLLTAPDFLLSRSKVVAQAFKLYNAEQRYFLLAQAAAVYMAARALNYLFDGDAHWEPENALSVVHAGRSYSARFLVNDLFNLAKDVTGASQGSGLGFIAGRLGPYPRAGIEALTGRDLRTGVRKDVPFQTDIKASRAAQIVAKDMVEWLVPVGAEGLPGLREVSGAAGRGDTAAGQVALAGLGVGSHKYTAQTQIWQLAAAYNRASNDPSAHHFQQRRDAEAHEASAYVKLDNLLDAGEPDRARKEYAALLAEGYRPESIARHYAHVQYYTGSLARERLFLQSLSAGQREIYHRAQAEREARLAHFRALLQLSPATP